MIGTCLLFSLWIVQIPKHFRGKLNAEGTGQNVGNEPVGYGAFTRYGSQQWNESSAQLILMNYSPWRRSPVSWSELIAGLYGSYCDTFGCAALESGD